MSSKIRLLVQLAKNNEPEQLSYHAIMQISRWCKYLGGKYTHDIRGYFDVDTDQDRGQVLELNRYNVVVYPRSC